MPNIAVRDNVPQPSNHPTPNLLKSSTVVGSMTMLSRVLGLFRDVILARVLGASLAADAFFVAFKIPNFMRRLFGEGAFSQAFVPVLAEYRSQRSVAAVQVLLDRVAGVLGGSLLLVTVLAVIGAPLLAALFAPGWWLENPEKFQLTSQMIRITFPYLLLIALTGFAGAILNSYGRFAIPAFTPVLLNVSLIAAALIAAPWFDDPAFALAWGVLLAGIIQLVFQLPFLHALRVTPKPSWDLQHEGVRRVLALMGPAIFGVAVSQINLLFDTILASFLQTGSVSWLYYSSRLMELPLGVFAIAISTVILPTLSRHQHDNPQSFAGTMEWGLRLVWLLGLPASLALLVLAEPILITLFQYGELHFHDVEMTSLSLRAYALGLLAMMLIKVLAPAYYARQDMRTPVRIGVKAMIANMVLNVLLVVPLAWLWQVGHLGLALATSLAAFLNAALLYHGLRRRELYQPSRESGLTILRITTAAIVMALVLWWFNPSPAYWLGWVWWERVAMLVPLCLLGVVVYGVTIMLLGARPRHFLSNTR